MTETKEPPAAASFPSSRLTAASKPTPAVRRCRIPVLRPLRIRPDEQSEASCYYTNDHVRALIADLGLQQPSSLSSRRRAAKELRMLTKHSPDNRLRIADAGAVLALVSTLQLLQSPVDNNDQSPQESDAELQEHAVTALYNLSLHDSNIPLIAASGAVLPAISMLGYPGATPDAKSSAACLLLRLARHGDGRSGSETMLEDIGRSDAAIPLLVDLLRTGELRGQKDAATALYALTSRWAPNRSRAARAGLVPVLLDLMDDPGSCMVDKAAYVLSAMVEDAAARAEVVECGGVAVLVDMLELGTREQKEIAVKVLVRMCSGGEAGGDEYGRVAVAEGAVPALLEVAQPESGCSARSRRKAKVLLEELRQTSGADVADQCPIQG